MTTRPRTCFACGAAAPRGRACGKPRCQLAQRRRWRQQDQARRLKKRQRCRFCEGTPLEGRAVCERHATRSEPCQRCAGPVPYHDGPGRQRDYCSEACQQAQEDIRRSVTGAPDALPLW